MEQRIALASGSLRDKHHPISLTAPGGLLVLT